MRLLDDVRLIESETLAPPTASTFERSITKLASYEHSDSWNKLCNSSWEYNRKPSLEENRGKIPTSSARLASKSRSGVRTRLSGTSQC